MLSPPVTVAALASAKLPSALYSIVVLSTPGLSCVQATSPRAASPVREYKRAVPPALLSNIKSPVSAFC